MLAHVRVQLLAVHTYRPTHHPRAHVLTLVLARPRGDRAEVTARTHTQRVRAANSLFGARGAPTAVSSRCICAPPPFSASSPRNLVEIPAGPTAMRIQNSRPNLRPRGPMLPTVTTVSVRPSNFEISSGEGALGPQRQGSQKARLIGSDSDGDDPGID